MATSTEVKDSVSGTVGHISPTCSNCIETGTTKAARSFCHECDLALCGTCEELHRKLASSHELEHYDNDESEADKDQSAIACSVHRKQEAGLFCEDHESLICLDCQEGEHSGCSVQTISDACDKIDVSMEMCKALDEMIEIEGRIEKIRREKQLKMNIYTAKYEERKYNIKTLRKKFINLFDRYEGEMEAKEATCKASLSSSIRIYGILSDKVKGEIQSLEDKHCKETSFQRLVSSKGVSKRINKELEEMCDTTASYNTTITEDKKLPSLLDQLSRLVHQDVTDSDEAQDEGNEDETTKSFLKLKSCTAIKTADPQVRSDKGQLWITGCCWLPDDNGIILCDYESKNKTLKILDKDMNITFTATCSGDPFDIALINEKSAVATFPCTKEIQFIEIKPGFKLKQKKNISFVGFGVGVKSQYIIVCGSESSTKGVKLLTLTGDDMSFIPYLGTGTPKKLCLGSSGNIYYTGGSGNDVYINCVTVDGHGIFSVSSQSLDCPAGIASDEEGNVLVCDENKRCVQIISSTGLCGNIVLTDSQYKPMAMCINRSFDLIIISWRNSASPYNSKLTLYRLKYD